MTFNDDIETIVETPHAVDDGVLLTAPDHEIWVRGHEVVQRLAKKIIDRLTERDDQKTWPYVDLACIGAACVNQAVKAIAVARESSNELLIVPFFSTITDESDRTRTRVMLRVTRCDS